MSMTAFFLQCGRQSTKAVSNASHPDQARHITIPIQGDAVDPPLQVDVWHSVRKCKRKESPSHYLLEELGLHIFVLGMVFLSPDQRQRLAGKISANSIDEDLIPVLYRQGGMAELQNLHGEFNLVMIDARTNEIVCLSSRFGLLPLYYAVDNDSLCVSDSLARLGEATGRNELDLAVVAQLCLYNYSLSNRSLLKDCYCLPAGTCLRYKHGNTQMQAYWTPDELLGKDLVSGGAGVDLIDEAFEESVIRYSSQIDRTALSLTGGWDGRLVLAYVLEHMEAEQVSLYSFGIAESPDVVIPRKIAAAMSLKYQPYVLDQEYLDKSFVSAAGDTALCSDGYRSVQRAHYLHAMRDLSKTHSSLISGICGSNVMKAAATTPSVVMNSRILQILSSAEPEKAALEHLDEMKQMLTPEFNGLDRDAWLGSVFSEELKRSLEQPTHAHRVSCFVFGILERKYFGPELASYRHLMANFSPFIDQGFVDALSRTEFFNAYRASNGIFGNRSNAILYARLIYRHNRCLAGFPSDKHIKLTNLLHPVTYPLVAAKQVYRRKLKKHLRTVNPYNTDDTLSRFIAANPGLCGREITSVSDKNVLGAYITARYWHQRSFHAPQSQR